MNPLITSVTIANERDVVVARRRACEIGRQLNLSTRECTRLGTAVSEIARNAFAYGGGGRVEFSLNEEAPRSLLVRVSDRGPGIAKPEEVLNGSYRSQTGLGLGIVGARRLVDGFDLSSHPGQGTTGTLKKLLGPATRLESRSVDEIAEKVNKTPYDVYDEVQQQNQELTTTLAELSQRQDELTRLNRELEETNRGVVALYAELDERAEHLRQADTMKSRFLSHLSHEFRTPLNGIIGLTRLLLNDVPGEEATRQIRYIQRAAEDLTELVDDLLDIAKADAGRLIVHRAAFTVADVFAALRGVFRALSTNDSVNLIFDEPAAVPPLLSDENKVLQIVRNLISNALKFTEKGEVRVSTRYDEAQDQITFSVADTGIGIAREHRERIFEEFAQIESPLQRRVKGTGLGLPLCKRLAELLGGRVEVISEVGVGSTFTLFIPREFGAARVSALGSGNRRLLVIDDDEISRYLLRNLLSGPHDILEASNGRDGLRQARELKPDMIFLDLTMPDMHGREVLKRLKEDPETAAIPVVIVTAQMLGPDEERELGRKAVATLSKNAIRRASALVVEFSPKITVSAQYISA